METSKFKYICDRCGYVEMIEHDANTSIKFRLCKSCDNGILKREEYKEENKSASIVHKYDEKAADIIRARKEQTDNMLAKIRHKQNLTKRYS